MNKIELLAPAGNFDCLVAAVQSGADAVYLSGKSFGARSFADNFDDSTIIKAIDYCHLRGVSVYVTVNTLVLDDETDSLSDYLRFLSREGADGIIVQDMGVVKLAKSIVPDLPVHASTQMTVHNTEGVRALEELGIKRVVLSREVSLENIRKIKENTSAQLEVFGHGALCMCYSGQCLMSSVIGGRSGNRGKCAQPCRLPYSINNKKSKAFYLSLKDLSSLKHLQKMQDIGIASLKIEGRMKGPTYVAAVVSTYRKYLDTPQKINTADIELLDRIFNRGGLTDGYLTDSKGPSMFAFDKPDNPYHKGSDIVSGKLLSGIKNENRKLQLKCHIELKLNEYPKISVDHQGYTAEYTGEAIVQRAQNNPLNAENVILRINKTGGTPFEFGEITVDIDDGIYLSASEINALRRGGLEAFENEYIRSYKRPDVAEALPELSPVCPDTSGGYICEVTSFEQFDTVKDMNFSLLYIPLNIVLNHRSELEPYKAKTVIVLPAIINENDAANIYAEAESLLTYGFYGISVNNIAEVIRFKNYNTRGSFRLNISNSYALDMYKELQVSVSELSPELNFRQLKNIQKTIPTQMMVYGRLPLMITENCVIKNGGGCPCTGVNYLTDRLGMRFPVIKDGDSCRSVILNCKKTFLGFDMDKIKFSGVCFYRMYFTDESPEECVRIAESFFYNTGYRPEDFTGGHFDKHLK